MIFEILKKRAGSRFKDVKTVKILDNCKNNKMNGIQTIKNSSEAGEEADNFVHVIKSVLQEYDKPVIVKIHDASSLFVYKELQINNILNDFEYSVQKICDFSCLDNKSRWNRNHQGNIEFCKGGNDKLHFIVYEYIESGDISEYLHRASQEEVACIFMQLAMGIVIMAYKYNISHGDLHSGNILIHKTNRTKIKYTFEDKSFFINTHGVIPIFIDFGMSKILAPLPENIMDDVFIAIQNCIPYINASYRSKFQKFLTNQFTKNNESPYDFIMDLRALL